MEAIIANNPKVILSSGSAASIGWQKQWLKWQGLYAVKANNLFTIPADLLERPGPRLILAAQMICRDLAQARAKP